MELKLSMNLDYEDVLQGSNRTFMELKFYFGGDSLLCYLCSNRTFMELKFASVCINFGLMHVLIVPLWN